MRKKLQARFIFILSILLLLSSCALIDDGQADVQTDDVTPISELAHTDIFREGALEHILEGELNNFGKQSAIIMTSYLVKKAKSSKIRKHHLMRTAFMKRKLK